MLPSQYDKYFETELSPSFWSKRFADREEVLENHINHAEKVSQEAFSSFPCELDIPYGKSLREKYDIFGTDLPEGTPILVFIHGGYWQELSRPQSRYPAKSLYKAGFKTIILGYDLCPRVTLFHIIEQIKNAVKAVLKYAKSKKSEVYFAGHSAGAHLIMKIISDEVFVKFIPMDIFKGVVLISGVFELTNLVKTSISEALHLTKEEAKDLSPQFDNYYHLKEINIKFYIVVGATVLLIKFNLKISFTNC